MDSVIINVVKTSDCRFGFYNDWVLIGYIRKKDNGEWFANAAGQLLESDSIYVLIRHVKQHFKNSLVKLGFLKVEFKSEISEEPINTIING